MLLNSVGPLEVQTAGAWSRHEVRHLNETPSGCPLANLAVVSVALHRRLTAGPPIVDGTEIGHRVL